MFYILCESLAALNANTHGCVYAHYFSQCAVILGIDRWYLNNTHWTSRALWSPGCRDCWRLRTGPSWNIHFQLVSAPPRTWTSVSEASCLFFLMVIWKEKLVNMCDDMNCSYKRDLPHDCAVWPSLLTCISPLNLWTLQLFYWTVTAASEPACS